MIFNCFKLKVATRQAAVASDGIQSGAELSFSMFVKLFVVLFALLLWLQPQRTRESTSTREAEAGGSEVSRRSSVDDGTESDGEARIIVRFFGVGCASYCLSSSWLPVFLLRSGLW